MQRPYKKTLKLGNLRTLDVLGYGNRFIHAVFHLLFGDVSSQ